MGKDHTDYLQGELQSFFLREYSFEVDPALRKLNHSQGILPVSCNRRPLRFAELHPEQLELAEELSLDLCVVPFALGLLRFNGGDYATAQHELERTLRADPYNIGARFWLGSAQFCRDNIDDAQKNLHTYTDLHPDQKRGWFLLGMTYYRQGRYRSAEESFWHAVTCERPGALELFLYGRCKLVQGRFDEAENPLEGALNVDSACYPAWYDLAIAEMGLNKNAHAEEYLRTYLGYKPDDSTAKRTLAKVKAKRGKFLQAGFYFLMSILGERKEHGQGKNLKNI